MATLTAKKGDTTPVVKITVTGYTDISSTYWTGKTICAVTLGGAALVDRAIVKANDSTGFLGYLTPTECGALTVGATYYLTHEVTNLFVVPPVNREFQNILAIEQPAN